MDQHLISRLALSKMNAICDQIVCMMAFASITLFRRSKAWKKFKGPFGGQDKEGHDMIVILSCRYQVFGASAGYDNTILSLILSCLSCVKVILRGELG